MVQPTPTQAENDLATRGLSVTNKVADGSAPDPNFPPPLPTLNTISPTTAPAGTVALTANGLFSDDSKIVFASVVQTSTLNGPKTQLTASIPGVTAGAKTVVVRNVTGDSASKTFTAT